MKSNPRVLLIAEAANPELTSVALIGHSLSQALAGVCDAHLVTERRNERSLLNAGVPPEFFTAISNPAQRVAFHTSSFLRGNASVGWTINSALSTLAYPLFELRVWKHFSSRLQAGEFDLVHRITPLSPTAPSYLSKKLAAIGVPMLLGPLNGGIPWPAGSGRIRRDEREWLGYARGMYRFLPGHHATRRNASALVLASRHTYGEVTGTKPELKAKSVWIPENAIDPERFPEIHIDPVPPAAGQPLCLAFVGRLVPYKGADILLEAAAPMLREGRVHLKIIGDGPQMPKLRTLAEQEKVEDSVQFTGWVAHENVCRHLSQAQVFAFPSMREFGGGVVLEAMALGLMPVVLDYGGPAELIPDDCGRVVPIGTRQQMIDSFRAIIEELADQPDQVHEAGLRAQRHVRTNYTWQAKARQLLEIYHWVLSKNSLPKPDPLNAAVCG
jgi:glycosyltransferase involved in cell wall biosynthesis